MVSKLQLYVQQLNSALEDTSQQVLSGMPRIMKDAQVKLLSQIARICFVIRLLAILELADGGTIPSYEDGRGAKGYCRGSTGNG